MSLTKRYIDEMMMMGVDVLHPDYQHSDDEYEYEKWFFTQDYHHHHTKKKKRKMNSKLILISIFWFFLGHIQFGFN